MATLKGLHQTITVDLGPKAYHIYSGRGLLDGVGGAVAQLLPKARQACIISDSNVGPLYGRRLAASLAEAGLASFSLLIPAGEGSKNLAHLGRLLEAMAQAGLTRSDLVLTLGGGVVGDLGGFAAACYMRGLSFVQVPTSLLAQIDSSVGGKVAVDLAAGKNLAGAFYQPKAVYIDTELLGTLPTRFLHDGTAEAIKYGCIKDAALFRQLAACEDDAALLAAAPQLVAACCAIKARIVEQDELDTGLRALLNFGHTLGHAVEQYYGYGTYTHGEGVAIGMYQLTKRTEALGLTAPGTTAALKQALLRYQLPLGEELPKQPLLAVMAKDKKKQGDRLTLVILKRIGEAVLHSLPWQEAPAYLA